ncbi:MAG: hypothetical protein AAFX07_16400, partial [Pseudomonadota bacterium]
VGQIEGPSTEAEDAELVDDTESADVSEAHDSEAESNASNIVRTAAEESERATANADEPPIDDTRAQDAK